MNGRDIILAELSKAGIAGAQKEVIADSILDALTSDGLAIYKKKVALQQRRPPSSAPMNPAIRASIAADFAANPDLTQATLAARYNVNIGRVNEIVNG